MPVQPIALTLKTCLPIPTRKCSGDLHRRRGRWSIRQEKPLTWAWCIAKNRNSVRREPRFTWVSG
jgi:hypothetical protein